MVEITSPFIWWTSRTSISGPAGAVMSFPLYLFTCHPHKLLFVYVELRWFFSIELNFPWRRSSDEINKRSLNKTSKSRKFFLGWFCEELKVRRYESRAGAFSGKYCSQCTLKIYDNSRAFYFFCPNTLI